MNKVLKDRLTLAFIAIACFWLGYQAAVYDIEMTGKPSNPFNPYVATDQIEPDPASCYKEVDKEPPLTRSQKCQNTSTPATVANKTDSSS